MTDRAYDLRLPPAKPFHPTTFLERGVTVPFTTPALGGTRARPGRGADIELIVPNPYGGRGVYIMPWRNICDLFRPTVHDRQLNRHILSLRAIAPADIRAAAREMAAGGLAGEEAKRAAHAGAEAERANRLLVNFLLLEDLIEQAEAQTRNAGRIVSDEPDKKRRALRAIAWMAPTLGTPASSIAGILELITDCVQHVGVKRQVVPSRVNSVLTTLKQTHQEVANWTGHQTDDQLRQLGEMVCECAALTLTLAQATIREILDLTGDVFDLLWRWLNGPRRIQELALRPEWLLDGWEQICLLWRTAGDHASHVAVLAEMAHLLPVLPREIEDWAGPLIGREELVIRHRVVPLNKDWRTGAQVFNLIARNEHLRALDMTIGLRAA
jgi:hypothetical protein